MTDEYKPTKVKVDARGGTSIDAHKENFLTLMRAFYNNDVMLVECTRKDTGEKVATICTISTVDPAIDKDSPDAEFDLVPFAVFLNDDPFDMLIPPQPDETDDQSIH